MNSFSTVSRKNTFIHRVNPCIKFLIYIIFVAILFIPTSLVLQIIFCLFIFALFFLAKLPQRTFWRTLLSVTFIFIFLFLINWFTYRNPGWFVVDNDSGKIKQLGRYFGNEMSNAFSVEVYHQGDYFFVNGQQLTSPDFVNKYVKFSGQLNEHDIVKSFGTKHYYFGALWGSNKEPWYQFVISKAKSGKISINPACYVSSYALSFRTIVISIFVFLKIFALIVLSTILTSTMTNVELTHALEDLLFPLKIFRFPVNEFAMILAITIRYIPTLLVEANRIMNAQSARGVDFKNGRLKDKVNSITSLVIPMFSVAFRRADELSFAMEARGYNPRYLRSRYRHFPLRILDIIIFAFVVAILCFFVIFDIKNVWIAPFDSFDWLTMFAKNCQLL